MLETAHIAPDGARMVGDSSELRQQTKLSNYVTRTGTADFPQGGLQ